MLSLFGKKNKKKKKSKKKESSPPPSCAILLAQDYNNRWHVKNQIERESKIFTKTPNTWITRLTKLLTNIQRFPNLQVFEVGKFRKRT